MSNFDINCFGQCLKSIQDQHIDNNKLKNKKGKKCLTLVRKSKQNTLANIIQTNPSTTLQKTRLQIKTQNINNTITNNNIIPQKKQRNNPHIIYGRYSNINTTTQKHYIPMIPIKRQRRLSQYTYKYQPFQPNIEIRSNSSQNKPHKQNLSSNYIPKIYNQILIQKPIQSIQQEDSPRRSSLFQGAKSIISKLASITKDTQKQQQHQIMHTAQKPKISDVRNFYDNARLCQTQHAINNTHSTIKSDNIENEYLVRQLSIDAIPMSPKSTNIQKYKDYKKVKLLGIGRWAHVYLCQQIKTNCIYTIKQIFKQSIQYPITISKIKNKIKLLINLSSPKLINIFYIFQNTSKLCIISQYCLQSLYDQLKISNIKINKIKYYLYDLIQSIVFLHQNDIVHGNINIFNIYHNFGQCKIKPNITQFSQQNKYQDYKNDIISLGITTYQMAYGISNEVIKYETIYERQRIYQDAKYKKSIIQSISNNLKHVQQRQQYKQLNNLIDLLINWNIQSRLSSSICHNHPFFKLQIK